MRRYRFKLEPVRRHRELMEEQKRRAVATALAEVTACAERIAALEEEWRALTLGRSAVIDVEELVRRERYAGLVRDRIIYESGRREELQLKLDDARAVLVAARQARRAIELVHERDYARWQREFAAAEQAALDEIAGRRAMA